MKVILEYTFHHLKKNKRYTISIMVAILIASILLCSLSILVHSLWKSKVKSTIKNTGHWHGELFDCIRGDKLKYVTGNPNVETTMIKGEWTTARLSNTKRPYLLMRDLGRNYWRDMNEKNALLEGRLPRKNGEIAVSKLFFSDNPSYKIGDRLDIPIGTRMLGDTKIHTDNQRHKGETFKVKGNKAYTIVGKLDIASPTAYPGYITMGYLDRSRIEANDSLVVYMRMKNPRKVYETLPEIAEAVGFKKDEYGKYLIKYNKYLLGLYGIRDKGDFSPSSMITPLIFILTTLLVIAAFVLIIYNGFSLSANARMKQLGILKSIGATPEQIKNSVMFEGLILSVFPIPAGIIIGYLFSNMVVYKINEILTVIEGYTNIKVTFSWLVIVFAVIIALITVLISAYIPARKVSKLLTIEAIRQNNISRNIRKKISNEIIKKVLGIEGEVAISQFTFHKKTFRTAIISLAICFILISGYLSIMKIGDLRVSLDTGDMYYDMSVNLNINYEPEEEMIDKIRTLPQIKDSTIVRRVRTSTYVESEKESEAFASVGGFEEVKLNKYNILKRDGKYRITGNIIGLDDEDFREYCEEIGVDYKEYYEEGLPKGVLFNSTYYKDDDSSKNLEKIPLLKVQPGDKFLLQEKLWDDMKTDNKFNIKVGYITDVSPHKDFRLNRYSLAFIVPMEVYENIVSDFMPSRALAYQRMKIYLLIGNENSPKVREQLEEICGTYLGSEDFHIWSRLENEINDGLVKQAIKITCFAIALMFGVIGISNAFSTISNNIKLSRREFAMLRSVGITPRGINKILALEGVFFAFKPILNSIPFIFLICWFALWGAKITWAQFLPVFPLGEILIYGIVMIVTVWISYKLSSKSIREDNVVDVIKDETL
ncbi:FtsX-like permease family protein [Dethiothermospora halolimnae]|uniref:ABC transporter permease n=1 Tax=Dethiothermospora halolimnae TaxID=3114390 RepID=UPI003CCBF7BD